MQSAPSDPLAWTRDHSPILDSFRDEYAESQPFDGYDIAVSSSLTTNTGVLIETIREAGASSIVFTSPGAEYNEPAVIEAIRDLDGVEAFIEPEMDRDELDRERDRLLETEPDFIIEDGCVLTAKVHDEYPDIASQIKGGVEQTTFGITRLQAMDRQDVLEYPVYGVNDTPMKHYFDNVHGTGETTISGIMTTTNTLFSGAIVVIVGYGYCGRGVARKAKGMGACTIVTEIDPRNALEARMDGHWVMPMAEAAPIGEYFVAASGNIDVIREEHFDMMSDGAIVASAGTGLEIATEDLDDMASETSDPMPGITRYHLPDGRQINILANGYVVNLAGPNVTGHPAEVMDMTFAMMFIGAYDMLTNNPDLSPGLHAIPDHLDRKVASKALEGMGVEIDEMTDQQRKQLDDWAHAKGRL